MRFSRRGHILIVLAGVALAAALLGRAVFQRDEAPRPAAPAQTAQLIYETHCAICHGLTGKGDGPGTKVTRQTIRDFSNPAAMREVDDRFLFEIIKKGSSQFGRSNAMPSWGMKLTDEEIHAVVAFIRSLASSTSERSGERKETP
jgi:mono/diheme cytochrome c family protein